MTDGCLPSLGVYWPQKERDVRRSPRLSYDTEQGAKATQTEHPAA